MCGFFDITNPDVQRILSVRREDGEPDIFTRAQCRCKQNEEKTLSVARLREEQANLPHPFDPRTFTSFKDRTGVGSARKHAQEFAEGNGFPTLVLVGEPGTGKSHLLEAIGRYALLGQRTVRYDVSASFLERLRNTYSHREEDGDLLDLLLWYQRQSIVLLDDLGAEAATDWAAQQLTSFIDQRLHMGLRLAIATNCTEEEMAERLGDRLASRLFQQNAALGEVSRVTLTASDYRMQKA